MLYREVYSTWVWTTETVEKRSYGGQSQGDFEQGFQGWEYKFNSVASSRGDYPFITMTCRHRHGPIRKDGHASPC